MFTVIDLSTVYLFGALVGILLAGIMGFSYFRLSTYDGFPAWGLSITCYSAGLLAYWLTSWRTLPYILVAGNLCFVAAPSLALLGTARFVGRRIRSWVVWGPVVLGFIGSASLSLIVDNRTLRIVLLSAIISATLGAHMWLVSTSRSKRVVGGAAGCLSFFLAVYMGYLLLRVGYVMLGFDARSGAGLNSVFQALTFAITCLSNVGMVFGYMAMTFARTEARLVESETRYRIMIEHSPESVIVQRDGVIIYANPAACRMFGAASAAELVGGPFVDRVHADYHEAVSARRNSMDESGVGGPLAEMVYVRLDGTVFDVETQCAPIVYDGARANQVTSHDITDLKRAAVERKDFERKLQEAQKLESLGLLASGIAHDFNNILTGILGNASLASLELPASSPIAENLHSIQQGSRRAADLCKQLLAYSGKGHLVVQNLSLNRLVEETAHLLKHSVSKKAVLSFALHPALSAVEADPTQIQQVIMNLVINASDAMGEDGGVIRLSTGLVWLTRDAAVEAGLLGAMDPAEGNYAFIEVSDSGCGMSAETKARIFDPFFTTKFTGHGLGLSAVLGIVRSHRGALRLTSEPGRGTTFQLLFPCVAGDDEGMASSREQQAPWRGQGRVLVVDDEAEVRSTAVAMLRRLGFEATLANDGLAAVETFRASPDRFAFVLMDLTMPGLDGKQAFYAMKAIRQDVRAVMMSGFNEQEASRHFSGHETAGFLQKPFGFDDLSSTVHKVLSAAPT